MPSVTVKEGYLHKLKTEGPQLLSRFAFKKRYFWLTSETLTYAKSPDWQVGVHPYKQNRNKGYIKVVLEAPCVVVAVPGLLLYYIEADCKYH